MIENSDRYTQRISCTTIRTRFIEAGKKKRTLVLTKGVLLLLTFFLSQGLLAHGQTSYPPLWSYETGDIIGSISVSSDGSYVAAGSHDAKLYFLNGSGNLLWSYETRAHVCSARGVFGYLINASFRLRAIPSPICRSLCHRLCGCDALLCCRGSCDPIL